MSALMMSSTLVAELSLAFVLGAYFGEFRPLLCALFCKVDFGALLCALFDETLSLREFVIVLAFFLMIYGLNFS